MAETENSGESVSAGTSLIKKIPTSVTKAVSDRGAAAIKHLVGAYFPGVLADSQAAKDERDARSRVTAALAEAAAKKAAANPELVDRMLNRLAGEELSKQQNREAIAIGALEHLVSEEEADETETPIDEDWLNLFGSYAEKASSEGIRDMWSRVLAGEIRQPGTFSPITLQFLALVDKNGAEKINSILPFVVQNSWIPKDIGWKLDDILFLEELGFLSGATGFLSITLEPQDHGKHVLRMGDFALVIDNEEKKLKVGIYTLSLPGRQLSKMIHSNPDIDKLITILEKNKPKSIAVGAVVDLNESRFEVRNLTTKFERQDQ